MTKMRQLRTELRQAGFISRQGKGSHEVWSHPLHRQRRIVLSGHNGDDAPKYQMTRIRKFR